MTKEIEFTYMSPAKLEELSLELWGDKWREAFCAFFDITYSQLHRYMTVYKGQTIPKRIAVAMDMLGILKANEIPFPTGDEHKIPVSEAQAIKFIPVAKPKVPRNVNDAPEADFFGIGEDSEEEELAGETEQPPEIETAPEQPEQDKSETGAGQEKKRTRTKKEPSPKAETKPARKRPAKKAA